MNLPRALISLPLAFVLAACGDTWGERSVTGGGIGAGALPAKEVVHYEK